MKRKLLILILIIAFAGGTGFAWWWHIRHEHKDNELVLYGNIDIRQVQLEFNNSKRILPKCLSRKVTASNEAKCWPG